MIQWLRAHACLLEDPSSVFCTHTGWLTTSQPPIAPTQGDPSPGDFMPFTSIATWPCTCVYTHTF